MIRNSGKYVRDVKTAADCYKKNLCDNIFNKQSQYQKQRRITIDKLYCTVIDAKVVVMNYLTYDNI